MTQPSPELPPEPRESRPFHIEDALAALIMAVLCVITFANVLTRHHLAITFLVDKLPARGRLWQRRFALACGLAMFGVLTWYGALMWWDDFETGLTSPGLGVPQWWYTLSVPVLSALVEFRLLQLLFKRASA